MVSTFFLFLLAASPTVETARANWAALDRGMHCDAVSQSLLIPPKGQQQPFVTLSFDRSGARKGQLAVRFKRPVRAGSSAMLTIGDQPFQLIAQGPVAWSRGPMQEIAILDAMRTATIMKVDARDATGRRMVDRYALSGAPTAIDAAAACAARLAKR
ncbi:MAG: hypothetical protein ABI412_05055 [Sphingomicrobium sp.]